MMLVARRCGKRIESFAPYLESLVPWLESFAPGLSVLSVCCLLLLLRSGWHIIVQVHA
jgi:hypothetical protein